MDGENDTAGVEVGGMVAETLGAIDGTGEEAPLVVAVFVVVSASFPGKKPSTILA